MFTRIVVAAVLALSSAIVAAQAIPPPQNPVVFCGIQAAPVANSYQLVFDGAAPTALIMDATKNAACPASSTHSFTVAAAKLTVGQHTLMVRATNEFGSTNGPVYTVQIGIAPGQFTINAVNP